MDLPAPLSATRLSAASERAYALSPENLENFKNDGFVSGVRVFDAERAEELASRVDWIRAHARELESRLYEVESGWLEDPEGVVFHCLGAWLVDAVLRATIHAPEVTVPSAQCLGTSRLRFWHDQIFTKPAGHPASVPWHQDYSYWQRTEPVAHVTIHIALDDSDVETGCLHYMSGSHEWGLFDPVPFDGPEEGVRRALPAEFRDSVQIVPCPLRRGEAVLHHSHTLHGSPPNRSDRPRRALVLNYIADGVRSASPDPLLRGTRAIPPGSVLDGPFYPLVLDRSAAP